MFSAMPSYFSTGREPAAGLECHKVVVVAVVVVLQMMEHKAAHGLVDGFLLATNSNLSFPQLGEQQLVVFFQRLDVVDVDYCKSYADCNGRYGSDHQTKLHGNATKYQKKNK